MSDNYTILDEICDYVWETSRPIRRYPARLAAAIGVSTLSGIAVLAGGHYVTAERTQETEETQSYKDTFGAMYSIPKPRPMIDENDPIMLYLRPRLKIFNAIVEETQKRHPDRSVPESFEEYQEISEIIRIDGMTMAEYQRSQNMTVGDNEFGRLYYGVKK